MTMVETMGERVAALRRERQLSLQEVADRAGLTKDARASLSCARTLKRLSWLYRNWALEDEAKGDRPAYLKHAAEARRLWRTAKVHLDAARRFAHGS